MKALLYGTLVICRKLENRYLTHDSLTKNLTNRMMQGKCKEGKFLPRTSHEGPDGYYSHSCTLSSTSALNGMGGQRHAPDALPSGKTAGVHFTGGWVGPRANLDGCLNFLTKEIRFQDRPTRRTSLYRLRDPDLPYLHSLTNCFMFHSLL